MLHGVDDTHRAERPAQTPYVPTRRTTEPIQLRRDEFRLDGANGFGFEFCATPLSPEVSVTRRSGRPGRFVLWCEDCGCSLYSCLIEGLPIPPELEEESAALILSRHYHEHALRKRDARELSKPA
jgi:hypothetical protein